jgi:hypothetical protein
MNNLESGVNKKLVIQQVRNAELVYDQIKALRNLTAQTACELAVLKRFADSQQLVIIELGRNMKSLSQQFQLLRDHVDRQQASKEVVKKIRRDRR